jgi:hypothetical protein
MNAKKYGQNARHASYLSLVFGALERTHYVHRTPRTTGDETTPADTGIFSRNQLIGQAGVILRFLSIGADLREFRSPHESTEIRCFARQFGQNTVEVFGEWAEPHRTFDDADAHGRRGND